MSENKMTPEERRRYNRAEFQRKFGEWWIVYVALFFTATLSFVSGVLLPLRPNDSGEVIISIGMIFASIYYALGFLVTGEGAFYFWFDKLTDHDPDNNVQVGLAWAMMSISIITSLTTALAAAGFIAYWLGVFSAFYIMPIWAQEWVVWAIPCFVVLHLVTGTVFRTVSDEATYERDAKATIRQAKNDIVQQKETAKADYWRNNASDLARELGQLEAQEEIANYKRKVDNIRAKQPQQQPRPQTANALEVTKAELKDDKPSPPSGQPK